MEPFCLPKRLVNQAFRRWHRSRPLSGKRADPAIVKTLTSFLKLNFRQVILLETVDRRSQVWISVELAGLL